MRNHACIYCGFTEDRACEIAIDSIEDDEIRSAARAAHDRHVKTLPVGTVLEPVIGCWWVSLDPAVCSAPACRERFAAAVRFDTTTGDPSRVIAGQATL